MGAIIQRLKKDGKRYVLTASSEKESEAIAKLQELRAQGRYAFIEQSSKAKYAGAKGHHTRFNVWARLEE